MFLASLSVVYKDGGEPWTDICSCLPQIHVHMKGCDTLQKRVSQRILPTEYGGDAGPLRDLWSKLLIVFTSLPLHFED
jgi:hypothetical protein